jgi:type IV secretory pathway TrbF-like protein
MIVGMAEDVLPAEDRIAHCTGELIAYVRSLFPDAVLQR